MYLLIIYLLSPHIVRISHLTMIFFGQVNVPWKWAHHCANLPLFIFCQINNIVILWIISNWGCQTPNVIPGL